MIVRVKYARAAALVRFCALYRLSGPRFSARHAKFVGRFGAKPNRCADASLEPFEVSISRRGLTSREDERPALHAAGVRRGERAA
jgi:hypothetical protein